MGNSNACFKPSDKARSNGDSTASDLTLVYWHVNGRSDFCQALLYAADIPFNLDDNTANNWGEHKDDSPFGQLPLLKHGELVLAQGGAINRYCARLGDLYPKDTVEASKCDMYMEEIMDIFHGLFRPKRVEGKEAKLSEWEKLKTEHLPTHFGYLEKALVQSGTPYLGGDTPNASDVFFFACFNLYDLAEMGANEVLDQFPKLKNSLDGTKALGDLENFPFRGHHFSANPENGAF
jgi:glutathione S-transferase